MSESKPRAFEDQAPERVWFIGRDPYIPCRLNMSALDHGDDYVCYVQERAYDQARAQELSDVIRTRLRGVLPEDQDVVLEDDDWNTIIEALIKAARGAV